MMNEDKRTIQSFKDLYAWQEGHELVKMVYALVKDFPKEELFGLVSQMRRCAVSITSNIAEGFGRGSYKEKVQFYLISRGSLIELENQLLIAKDVGYMLDPVYAEIDTQLQKVQSILNGLIKKSKSFT